MEGCCVSTHKLAKSRQDGKATDHFTKFLQRKNKTKQKRNNNLYYDEKIYTYA